MITSKQVKSADKEAAQLSSLEQLDRIEIPNDISPEERQIPVATNVLFKLCKPKKGRMYLDNCCDHVMNPKTKKPERIWLLNGAHSIWDSELENILKDKSRYERSRMGRDIVFVDSVCMVRTDDVYKLEFMRANRHNVGNKQGGNGKWDFYEYSPVKEAEERQKRQALKIKMVIRASEMDCGTNGYGRKLAAFLGIPMVDDLGMPKVSEAISTELTFKADNDPVTFSKYVDSKEVEISWLVKRAIIDAKIDLGGATGNATWANGKGFIAKIPQNRKPYEYLTELAMTNSEDGKRFLEQLKTIVV